MIETYYPQADSTDQEPSALWTYVEAPSKTDITELVQKHGLPKRLVHDALDHYEIPRLETVDDATYIITRFAYQTESGTISTAPILFALRAHELISISSDRLPQLDALTDSGEHAIADASDPVLLMLTILLAIDSQYDTIIHDLSRRIRHLHSRLGKRDVGVPDFIGFVAIEDSLNDLLNSLEPTNSALRHLLSTNTLHDFAGHREVVDTVVLNNEQSIQACAASLKSLDSIRRTYSLINSHRLDRTIKILTLASVFISIPTMFFSMYGMNIPLPWMHDKETFLVMIVVCLILVGTAFTVGRKRHIF